ncbi:hypothetical protein K435DRAFT_868004 [Dendrothele bispora CBS 962.96]|uniref:Uncharacterized protein n=1 Tax=Dendrothele bispora (strain CBS 962.96) TaxID=1314807 RepID=A0A4V4HDF3_DENBC|nr:hypothetical protein K435DRAFT_868004 [Dendrothele bispora CBS 962.96]
MASPVTNTPPRATSTLAARAEATHKRLRPEQMTDVEQFLNSSVPLQNAWLLIQLHATNNAISQIVKDQAPFDMSEDLKVCVSATCVKSILFTLHISSYEGKVPVGHAEALVKTFCWGLPDGIENDAAAWSKVMRYIGDELTQLQFTFKKTICQSLTGSMKNESTEKIKNKLLPKDDCMTIYALTKKLTLKSKAAPTLVLCAHIALMRYVFLSCPGDKFWDQVDSKLKDLCKAAAEGAIDAAHFRISTEGSSVTYQTIQRHNKDATSTESFQSNIDKAVQAWDAEDNEEDEEEEEEEEFPGPNDDQLEPAGNDSQLEEMGE